MGTTRTNQKQRVEREWSRPLHLVLMELAYARGMGHQAIADHLGVPVGTVASWFARESIQAHNLARLYVRDKLGEGEGEA